MKLMPSELLLRELPILMLRSNIKGMNCSQTEMWVMFTASLTSLNRPGYKCQIKVVFRIIKDVIFCLFFNSSVLFNFFSLRALRETSFKMAPMICQKWLT